MAKIKHKILLYILIFAILLSAVGVVNITNNTAVVFAEDTVATSTWDGSTYEEITSGSGSQEDPYLIETAGQFVQLSKIVDTAKNSPSTYYKLTSNIDLAGPRKTFTGIGSASKPFKANFDGNNLTISNFKYGSIDMGLSTVNVGLFNSIDAGSVKNVKVDGASIAFTGSKFINLSSSGNFNCGVICGFQTNGASIENTTVSSATLTINYASLSQYAVGGIVGRSFNNSNVKNSNCLSVAITNSIVSNIDSLEIAYTGLIVGSMQSGCYIEKSYSDSQCAIKFSQSASATAGLTNNIGGLAGILASNCYIQQSYSNFDNLILTSNASTTNNVGGLVGKIDSAYIQNSYAKNSLFKSAVADTSANASINTIGGLIGSAIANSNLYNQNNKFLSYCYIVVDSLNTDTFGSAKVGALIGNLDLTSAPSAHKSTATMKYSYYVAKNQQTLTDYNVTSGNKYTGENIVTELSNDNAKNVNNFTGFDTEYIWSNDLSTATNDGYPILMGVGNNIIPQQKQTFTIYIDVYLQDENGTNAQPTVEVTVEEDSTVTYQLTVPENYTVNEPSASKSMVDVLLEGNNLVISNPTGSDIIEVFIIKNQYTITLVVSNNEGGNVAFASGSGTIYHGGTASVVVTPQTGYKFIFETGVQISDNTLSASKTENGFSVANIVSNITLTVTFTRYYTISLNIITLDNSAETVQIDIEVNKNSSATYQISVSENYQVKSIVITKGLVSASVDTNNLLTLSNPIGDDTVEIEIDKQKSYLHQNWKDQTSDVLANSSITEIYFTSTLPNNYSSMTTVNIGASSSTDTSTIFLDTVIAYISGTVIIIYSPVEIYAPQCSSFLFSSYSDNSTLKALTTLIFNNFNTSYVTNMYKMFYNCTKLTSLDLSGFNTTNVTDMSGMFSYCVGLKSAGPNASCDLNFSGWDTSNVTNMSSMFDSSTKFTSLDVSKFNTSSVTNMSRMFANCLRLISLDLSNFDTSKITDMSAMFTGCNDLTSVGSSANYDLNLSSFNTALVTNMSYMFSYCQNLTTLDVSKFNTSSVINMNSMFAYCRSLTSVGPSASYDLNLSNFNTSKVTDMGKMFYECSSLTILDLNIFIIGTSINVDNMFKNCSVLNTIITPKTCMSIINLPNGTWYQLNISENYLNINASYTTLNLSNTNMTIKRGYTIELDNQNATTSGTTSVVVANSLNMPVITLPTKTGYEFGGYFTEINGSGTQYYTAEGTSEKVYDLFDDTTLYAYWTIVIYEITFDQQGGSGGTSSVTISYGSEMPRITKPVYAGYEFDGYFTGINGSGTQYYTAEGTGVKNWDIEVDTTLYAKWTIKQYTITLAITQQADGSEGGTFTFADGYTSTVNHGQSTSLVITKDTGYRFDFNTGLTFSETGYVATQIVDGDSVTPSTFVVENITDNLTITIKFIKFYTINVSASDQTVGLVSNTNSNYYPSIKFDVDAGNSFYLYQKIADDKVNTNVFVRWKLDDGTELGTTDTLQYTPTADVNIIAEYDVKYYSLTVVITEQTHSDNNIVKINNTQVKNGDVLNTLTYMQSVKLNVVTDENCYILTAKLNTQTIDIKIGANISFNMHYNITLTIQFADYINVSAYAYSDNLTDLQNYTNSNQQNYVGFAQNPTQITESQKFKADQSVTVYALAHEKYVFEGWFAGDSFENASLVTTSEQHTFTATSNILLFAKFSINTYTITIKQILVDENGTTSTTVHTQQTDYKGSLEYSIPVPTNYEYVDIESNCGAIYDQTTGKISITNILASDTVSVTFEKQKYSLTVTTNQGGTVKIDGKEVLQLDNIYHNTNIQIEILIDDGYKLYLSNVQISGSCNYNVQTDFVSLENITSDIQVNITFTKYYVVKISTNVNDACTVSLDGIIYQNSIEQQFDQGQNISLFARVEDAFGQVYEFKRWINSTDAVVSTSSPYIINNLNSDINLTAYFTKIGYSISVSLNEEISNSNNKFTINNQNVSFVDGLEHNSDIIIKYNLDKGAYLEKIVISTPTEEITKTSNEITNNTITYKLLVNTTITIFVKTYKFKLNLYANNGILTFKDGTTIKTVTAYDTIDVVTIANEGYEFDFMSQPLGYYSQTQPDQNGVITFSDFTNKDNLPIKELSITANFKIKTYNVVVNYGINGSVTINNTIVNSGLNYVYNYGSNLTFNFTPNSEYYLNGVMLNGVDISSQINNGIYVIDKIMEDATFAVDFGIKKYSLNLSTDFDDVNFKVYANGSLTNQTNFESGTQIEIIVDYPNGYSYQGLYYQNEQTVAPTQFVLLQDTSLYAKVLAEVVIEQSQYGYITVNGVTTNNFYDYGSLLAVEIFADIGYQFNGFEYGFTIQDNNTFAVTKTVTLKAVFTSKATQVTVSAGEHGKINTSASGVYYIGDIINLKASVVETGYHFAGYSGTYSGELENELITTYTILPQDAENGSVEIIAYFEIDVYDVLITSNYGGKLSEIGSKTYAYGMVINVEVEIYDKYSLISILYNQAEDIQNFIDNNYTINVTEPITVEFVFSPVLWIDYADTPSGLGTSDNPFVIKTAEQLAFIALAINNNYPTVGKQVEFDVAYYQLANDIDLDGKFWTPIGTTKNPFNGVFDFNYFAIKNLSVIDDVSQYQYGGLFGVIGEHGKIINQFRNYTALILFISLGVVVLVLLVLLIIYIERRRRKPKRVIVLPTAVKSNNNTPTNPNNIKKPDLSKWLKK